MENNDTMFFGIMIVAAIILIWAMISNWIDSIKLEKAKKRKEQEEAETKIKREREVVKLTKWFYDCLEPKDENVINSATFKFKQTNYEDVKEAYPILVNEDSKKYPRLETEDITGAQAMTLLVVGLGSIYDLEEKGYFKDMLYGEGELDYFNLVEGDNGIVTWTISMKEEDQEVEAPKKRSRRISQKVKDLVWNRDGGECVECGSNENLEFDHIIPHSKGGANTYRNIQLLCEPCNRSKSAKIG